ncbi:YidB family protein [Ideonella margarita]|uniref:YidB family protein n=1 Tax=Ideonella margarita TaxID=2984191 RepID=A0ABU9C459_9BURK
MLRASQRNAPLAQGKHMGLLDSMVGMLGQAAGGQNGGQGALLQVVAGLLDNNAPGGGLAGLVQQFQQGGLGDVVSSWISTGQNLPINPSQLQSVLEQHPQWAGLAQQAGLDNGQLMGQLSQMLPQVIDQMTPNGQLPGGNGTPDLGALLGGLLGR